MKQAFLILFVLFINMTVLMAQYEIKDDAERSVFPWPEGKRCAVSLTFDDARLSQIDLGIPLLNRYDVKATFYISPEGLLERLDGWRKAVAAGHEIGNHTMTHPCTGNYAFSRDNALEEYDLDRIGVEMDDAGKFILEQLGVEAQSFAYPCGQKFVGRGTEVKSYVPLVAGRFLTGRGWLGEDANDPWQGDFSQLLGMESDGKSFEQLKILIDKAAAEGRWLILAGHEMNDAGHQTTLLSALEALCDYAKNPSNGIWIDTVSEIATYIQKNRPSGK
ncbi:polysaccharide deacetylase [candidate division KSB1 bacterium]|nr:polysaccharide deacetylase family protein [candidate division KSB1 bacterium]RQW07413.1 MAG: polysaccharide deacetylase [candidate division KSB1 bacterium]